MVRPAKFHEEPICQTAVMRRQQMEGGDPCRKKRMLKDRKGKSTERRKPIGGD